MHSWRILILPYINQESLFKEYDFREPWNGPNNSKLANRMPRIYAFPGDRLKLGTTTNYVAVIGPETVWNPKRKVTMGDIKDGTSSTILLVENHGAEIHWMDPRGDLPFDEIDLSYNSPKGISSKYFWPAVATVDGNLRILNETIEPRTLRALFTIAGDEPIVEGNTGWEWIEDGRLRKER